jgi:hypothetical protein
MGRRFRRPISLPKPLAHITDLRYYTARDYMVLDEATKRNLELTRTLREGKGQGSWHKVDLDDKYWNETHLPFIRQTSYDLWLRAQLVPAGQGRAFLEVEGDRSTRISLAGNDLSAAGFLK